MLIHRHKQDFSDIIKQLALKFGKATIHYDFIFMTLLIDRPLAFDELPLMLLKVRLCIKCQFLIPYKTQLIH